MTIVEEHRTKIRAGENTYSIEVTALPGGDQPDRLVVSVNGEGPQGAAVAEGHLEVASTAATALGSVLAETLRHHVAISMPGGRSTRARPAHQGRPWTTEQDAELESRWIRGDSIDEIAVHFERSPGGIRARLPRVGCDPERPGEYLPEPPSQRAEGMVMEDA
ncbi:helix-turn-helix domain containing protein [Amycolatopsis sp. GM8]|uniref:helix-turn-helix domain containing protein n=1 Tax=Amycolatopsis sp. GM8 TaxID=2896530 RepID=UPI001F205F96|nr:helix-turn-helix domain containing protein [Amycolatopsis sp. GM8]